MTSILPVSFAEEEKEPEVAATPEDPDEKRVRDFPLPVTQKAAGLRLPNYSETGKMISQFIIGSALRKTKEIVEMEKVTMEMYDDNGKPEYTIDLPASTLDLRTGKISSSDPITIKNPKFELSGEKMEFDTKSREGRLIGRVSMTIYDMDGIGGTKTENE